MLIKTLGIYQSRFVSTLCQRLKSRVKTGYRVSCQRPSNLTVVAKPIHLMHPLMQDCDDADVTV